MATDPNRVLDAFGVIPSGPLTCVRDYPWSAVWRVPTGDGDLWLKQCRGANTFEPALVELLAADATWPGPELIATRGPWILTRDAGIQVDDHARSNVEFLRDVQAPIARLQQRWMPDVDQLAATGITMHDLGALDALLDDLVSVSRTRYAHVDGALDDATEAALRAQLPSLQEDALALDALGIGPSVQHDDLHAGNVLVDDAGRVTIIDWGDAYVAHPFTHLAVSMHALAHDLGVGRDDEPVAGVSRTYLEQWLTCGSLGELQAAAQRAVRIGTLLRADSWRRALVDAGPGEIAEYGGAVPGWLRRIVPGDA